MLLQDSEGEGQDKLSTRCALSGKIVFQNVWVSNSKTNLYV